MHTTTHGGNVNLFNYRSRAKRSLSTRKLFQIFFHIAIGYFAVHSRFTSVNYGFFRNRSVSEFCGFTFFGISTESGGKKKRQEEKGT